MFCSLEQQTNTSGQRLDTKPVSLRNNVYICYRLEMIVDFSSKSLPNQLKEKIFVGCLLNNMFNTYMLHMPVKTNQILFNRSMFISRT